ncbi:unnamed protein product [Protopolystoma xenopodis]|uniref:Uncharacterized protein n=1 Tax=Protopolystoma xenopodis TaxID=117903 RepID=A0A448WL16_9PLAT|nr:unnamed protein product [Protopolystoma xenopodis]
MRSAKVTPWAWLHSQALRRPRQSLPVFGFSNNESETSRINPLTNVLPNGCVLPQYSVGTHYLASEQSAQALILKLAGIRHCLHGQSLQLNSCTHSKL